eukprot:372065-Amphidinium_carterae.1
MTRKSLPPVSSFERIWALSLSGSEAAQRNWDSLLQKLLAYLLGIARTVKKRSGPKANKFDGQ